MHNLPLERERQFPAKERKSIIEECYSFALIDCRARDLLHPLCGHARDGNGANLWRHLLSGLIDAARAEGSMTKVQTSGCDAARVAQNWSRIVAKFGSPARGSGRATVVGRRPITLGQHILTAIFKSSPLTPPTPTRLTEAKTRPDNMNWWAKWSGWR